MRKREPAAGFPAVILPGIVTEQDRIIVARRQAGETRKAICEALGVKVGRVYHAEYACQSDERGRAMLADCPDSIEGLSWINELHGNAYYCLHYHHYHHEGPALERLADVAALGRAYVSRMAGIGPKSLASIDRALALFGIAWSPVDRTPKPKSPAQPQEAARPPATAEGSAWSSIVRRIGEIERIMGTGVFDRDPQRDSIEYVSMRLSFLTGYLDGYVEKRRPQKPMRDITPEADSEDLETAGNLVCLPGVRLVDVLPLNDGAGHDDTGNPERVA